MMIITPEFLTTYDQYFNIKGEEERSRVHTKGLWHAVVHCWVISHRKDGCWIWFQKRAHTKTAFPDYYDTAVGGHIRAGEPPIRAVLREIQEEIGLQLKAEQLQLLGVTKEDAVFAGSPFLDREFCFAFSFEEAAPQFCLGEEVDDMVRIRLSDLREKEIYGAKIVPAVSVSHGEMLLRADQFCIHPGEFEHLILPRLEVS